MVTKRNWRAAICAAGMVLAMAFGTAHGQGVPLATGEHWTKASDQQKKAYLVGIANVLDVEETYHAANPPSDAQSIVPRMIKGLKGQTLDSVRETLDRWYSAHPDQMQRPVIETIWFEIVVPGLGKK
jgi:hypothetical protein